MLLLTFMQVRQVILKIIKARVHHIYVQRKYQRETFCVVHHRAVAGLENSNLSYVLRDRIWVKSDRFIQTCQPGLDPRLRTLH